MNKTEALVKSFEARRRVLAYRRELQREDNVAWAQREAQEARDAKLPEQNFAK